VKRLVLLFLLVLPATAQAQTVQLADGLHVAERASNPAQKYGTNGANVFLPTGAILGVRDIQGGTWVPGVPSLLNLDIGAGNAQDPGILNLGADVTRMVRIQNGAHDTVLATRSYGVAVRGRLTVNGVDLLREMRRLCGRRAVD
jgi:hypothetical protein